MAFSQASDDGHVSVIEAPRRAAFAGQRKPFQMTVSAYPADWNSSGLADGSL
jgi:hypothetical protein